MIDLKLLQNDFDATASALQRKKVVYNIEKRLEYSVIINKAVTYAF